LTDNILFFAHYILILVFGIIISFSFAGVRFTRRNLIITGIVFAVCGLLQLFVYIQMGESAVWKVYPLITHLPIGALLYFYYHKRISTILAAISSAYLCCQLPKWLGIMVESLFGNETAGLIVRIAVILCAGYIAVALLGRTISEIYSKDTSSVLIFGSIPMVYYLFDYSMGIYTDFWLTNNRMATEFMPFFLCIIYFLFCTLYFREYERKAEALRKEQITALAAKQQEKEMAAVRRSEHEIRILRHDMKHYLDILAGHLRENDTEASIRMVESLTSKIQDTSLHRFCTNDMVNYVLSSYTEKCSQKGIRLETDIRLEALDTDEIMFCSILSNALDNALNAASGLDEASKVISLMLRTSGGKLLLSVQNPFSIPPVFADGVPVSRQAGHGYGAQSIRYMTEKLGGNCQFAVQGNLFILRVVI